MRAFLKRLAGELPFDCAPILCSVERIVRRPYWQKVERWHQFIKATERWSAERLEELQLQQFRELLSYAARCVPYYARLFKSIGLDSGDIKDIRSIQAIPLLTKEQLTNNTEQLLSTAVPPSERVYTTTGGSTGIPVGLYFDATETRPKEWAFVTDSWRRLGYFDGVRLMALRGSVLQNGAVWEKSPFHNTLTVSSYHLTEQWIEPIWDQILSFRPEFIHAYPSAITLLARLVRERGLKPPGNLRAVLCASENLYDWQREVVESVLNCQVHSFYGMSEKVCMAAECEYSTRLHIYSQYGLLELIDDKERQISEPGQVGEIVGTGFLSRAMPLIRYRTGDMAAYAEGYCARCGRNYKLLDRIEGRRQEFIVTRTGRLISMTAVNMHTPVFDEVRQFRFVQEIPGVVTLKVIPKNGYSDASEMQIRKELMEKLGPDFELMITQVDEIQLSVRGKHTFLEQRLKIDIGG